ncbi:AraC family transcriptional regulator [Dokdonella soli]|uniref:HTH araC/xylS-type domain-containing protein n=1 Tax=Dokdonella soli TaxID=529810 RepID=A0ABN1IUK6_9GAMM
MSQPPDPSLPTAPRQRIDAAGLRVVDTIHAGATELDRHEHAEPYVCVVLDGSYEQRSTALFECAPGSVVLHPGGHAHANRFHDTGARCVNIQASGDWLADGSFARLVADYRHLRLQAGAVPIARLARALDQADAAAPLAIAAAALDLLASLMRVPTPRAPLRWIDRVIEALEADLARTPSLAELGTLANVHPAHLARAFRQARGETIGDYLRRRRLEQADRALTAGDEALGAIALAAGFYDQSHFTRAFRHRFGQTPLQRRRTVQLGS